MDIKKIIKSLVLLILTAYFLYPFFFGGWHFMDNVDWFIHESGHVLTSWMGQYLYILGGSLFQIIVPLSLAIYFYIKGDHYGSSIIMLWLGQSLFNLSVYVKDADVMILNLTGDIHDWNYLLSSVGMVSQAPIIGASIYYIGILCIIIGFLMGIRSLRESEGIY